jgi:hypothetical protein
MQITLTKLTLIFVAFTAIENSKKPKLNSECKLINITFIDSSTKEVFSLIIGKDSIIERKRSIYSQNRDYIFFNSKSEYCISNNSIFEIEFGKKTRVFDFSNQDTCQQHVIRYSKNFGKQKRYFITDVQIDSMHFDSIYGYCYIRKTKTYEVIDSALNDMNILTVKKTIYHPFLQDVFLIYFKCYGCAFPSDKEEESFTSADYLYFNDLCSNKAKKEKFLGK